VGQQEVELKQWHCTHNLMNNVKPTKKHKLKSASVLIVQNCVSLHSTASSGIGSQISTESAKHIHVTSQIHQPDSVFPKMLSHEQKQISMQILCALTAQRSWCV